MKALIHNGRIVEVSEEEFPVHKDMRWVDLSVARDKIGWAYNEQSKDTLPPPVREAEVDKTEERLKSIEDRLTALETNKTIIS